jgi:hypothetical protein
VIQDNISSVAKELLFHHYEELKESIISREEMVKKMIIIVGEKILLEALKKLHYCPSLWYKPSVEAVSSHPVMAAQEQLSLDKAGGNCSLTLNVNHGDSHAPNAVAEHATVSNKGCDALATDMVPNGHECLAASGVPETSNSASVICGSSTSVEPKGRDSHMQIVPPGTSATLCAKNHGSSMGRMAPIVHDGLLRTISGNSASPGQVCKSATPIAGHSGYASLAQTNASKPHGVSAPGLTSKGYESVVPSLALGNSKSTGVKRLNSAPRMTPEGQEFLSLGIASRPPHLVKLQAGLTSVAIPPVHMPGCGKSSSMSTEGRDSLTLSITPKCNGGPALSQAPKRHESPIADTSTKGHDSLALGITPKGNGVPASSKVPKCHESAIADTGTKGHDSLALSITPKGHDGTASSKTPKQLAGTLPESGHSQGQDVATKVYRAPKPITGEPKKEQAAVPAAENKPSGPSLDASSHVTGAANALVALSTLREKGGH